MRIVRCCSIRGAHDDILSGSSSIRWEIGRGYEDLGSDEIEDETNVRTLSTIAARQVDTDTGGLALGR